MCDAVATSRTACCVRRALVNDLRAAAEIYINTSMSKLMEAGE
jgi:hypothetical protein